MYSFIETRLFSRLLGDYLTDDQYAEPQGALTDAPDRGALVPGSAASGSYVGHSLAGASAVAFESSTTPRRKKESFGC